MENGPEENGPELEYDPAKDVRNIEKHGVSLAVGLELLKDEGNVVFDTIRKEDGEDRYRVIGKFNQLIYTGIYVRRGMKVRFISVRRSSRRERQEYADHSRTDG